MPQSYLNLLTPRVAWSPPDSERDRPIMGALIGERATLIVEAGASPTHAIQFLRALAELNVPAPRFAAVTHWHWDHVFGAEALRVPLIAHVETRKRVLEMTHLDWRDRALDARVAAGQERAFIADHLKVEMSNAERSALEIIVPELTFTDQMEVDLGGLTAHILHVGGDHTPDSSVIYTPEERVAFIGDCFYSGSVSGDDCYTPERLLPLLATLEALPVDTYVLSHNPTPWPRAEFVHEAEMLRRTALLVQRTRGDRQACLDQLEKALGEPLNEDRVPDLEALLRGIDKE